MAQTLQISSGNPVLFTVTVTTSGRTSGNLPFSNELRSTPFSVLRVAPGLILGIVLVHLLILGVKRISNPRPKRLAFASAFAAVMLLAMLGAILAAVGCGAGSAGASGNATVTTPPATVTSQGTSIIIVAPSATSTNGKPLLLQPIQLTLTVN